LSDAQARPLSIVRPQKSTYKQMSDAINCPHSNCQTLKLDP